MMDVFKIDSIDAYNRLVGLPTRHPFVAVVDLKEAANPILPVDSIMMYMLFFSRKALSVPSVTDVGPMIFSGARLSPSRPGR